jgi:hypothetical protein
LVLFNFIAVQSDQQDLHREATVEEIPFGGIDQNDGIGRIFNVSDVDDSDRLRMLFATPCGRLARPSYSGSRAANCVFPLNGDPLIS